MTDPLYGMDALKRNLEIQALKKPDINGPEGDLKKACNEFESLFVKYMMQQMRETIPENGLFGRSQAEKIYTGMMDDEIAKSVSHGRGVGLAKIMYEQMAAIHGNDGEKK